MLHGRRLLANSQGLDVDQHTLMQLAGPIACMAVNSLSVVSTCVAGLLCIVCGVQGLSIILPALPNLATNYFASQHAGHEIDCEQYSLDEQPPSCQVGGAA